MAIVFRQKVHFQIDCAIRNKGNSPEKRVRGPGFNMLMIGGIIGTRILMLTGVIAAEYENPVEYFFHLKL